MPGTGVGSVPGMAAAVPASAALPVSALLSQALIAFTIECDNEFEHELPHRTSRGPAARSGRGPWLVSMAMWANFMRFIDEDGVPLRQVEGLARLTNLPGLTRDGAPSRRVSRRQLTGQPIA